MPGSAKARSNLGAAQLLADDETSARDELEKAFAGSSEPGVAVNRALCGFTMSAQWVIGCPGAGDGVTPCLTMQLQLRGHQVQNQDKVIIRYKQFQREEPLRFGHSMRVRRPSV